MDPDSLPDPAEDTRLTAEQRRRRVVRYLDDKPGEVASLDELAARIARCSATDAESASISLHHVDLPKLAEAGFVDYDSRSNTVRYRPETASTEVP